MTAELIKVMSEKLEVMKSICLAPVLLVASLSFGQMVGNSKTPSMRNAFRAPTSNKIAKRQQEFINTARIPSLTTSTVPKNLLAGVTGPFFGQTPWNGYSTVSRISGASLYPISSANTVLYLGFAGGTMADISNMVLYRTPKGSTKISSVTPVRLGGITNPSVNLSSASVCPVQPIIETNPCIVRLDPIALPLSPLSDYYFAVYFGNDLNNYNLSGTAPDPSFPVQSFLRGLKLTADETQLTVGQSVPDWNQGGGPYFLMYVMSN